MKNKILSVICLICAVSLILSCLTATAAFPSYYEPVGKMSAVYAYVLNDYLYKYGALSTTVPGETFGTVNDVPPSPTGVIYSEIMNFDENDNPYLVIFFSDGAAGKAACHIWHFNEDTEKAVLIAALEKNMSELPYGVSGAYCVGRNGGKRYLSYKEISGDVELSSDYYTVINGDTFIYVNDPPNVSEVGIMDFNSTYFHPGIDISSYNMQISKFFESLKNSAADSVTYEDIAEYLCEDDEAQVEKALGEAVKYNDFDIARYNSFVRYESALDSLKTNTDRFYLISNMYDLGDEIYYVRFSTDKSYYNYALLRRSPDAETGYQILKVRTDCIPLSDIELRDIKEKYKRNTLLYKKARGSLKLEQESKYFTAAPEQPASSPAADKTKKPKIKVNKVLSRSMRLPAACVGGGISIALLTALWLYTSSDDK